MNLYYLGNTLDYATLLMTAGLGAVFALKNGQMNLGGEGEIYAGGFTAAIILDRLAFLPFPIAHTAASLSAMAVCAILMIFCTAIRIKKGAPELLTSFLLSAALIPLIDGAVTGRFRMTEGNLIATPFIAEKLRLQKILPPSTLNISFAAAVVLCIAGGMIIYRTRLGKRIHIFGTARQFALYSGYPEFQALTVPMIISGALHGLAGYFAVAGTYYTCHAGFYSGTGWNALSCALIARSNPYMLIPVSIVLSALFTQSERFAMSAGLDFNISALMQGLILTAAAFSFITDRKSFRRKKQ